MRLDAATDNLLQTRDLFIRHLEQQLLQLQDVRSALQEAAEEVSAPRGIEPLPATPNPVKPMGELTLESLFAPLNAAPRSAPPPVVDVEFISEDQAIPADAPPAGGLFEADPVESWEASAAASPRPNAGLGGASLLGVSPVTSSALATDEIDPNLEKATLDELNEALTRAFAHIANRGASN